MIGSVFLGDFQRHRNLSSSTSTPPSSPPPSTISTVFPVPNPAATRLPMQLVPTPTPASINPTLALDLRLRWLETILLGVKQDARDKRTREQDGPTEINHGGTLFKAVEDLQRRLHAVVDGNEGLEQFINHYDQHAHLLTPAFALSGILPDPPSYGDMSTEQLEAFLTEMEPDIRAADRDMQEIELLEQKGIISAGKLADYEALQPRLEALLKARQKDAELAATLEKRIARLMERHATHADALSELFVAWDDTITVVEDKVSKFERERDERRRLGFEYS